MPPTPQFADCPNVTALSGYARVTPLDGAPVVGWCEYQRVGDQDMVWVQQSRGRVEMFNLSHVVRLTFLSEHELNELRQEGVGLESILQAVCQAFAFSPEQLRSPRRDNHICLARFFFYKLAREVVPHPQNILRVIGEFLSRDHGSVSSGIATLEAWMEQDRRLAARYEDMRAALVLQHGTEELIT